MNKISKIIMSLVPCLFLFGCGGTSSYSNAYDVASYSPPMAAQDEFYNEEYIDDNNTYNLKSFNSQNNGEQIVQEIELKADKLVYHSDIIVEVNNIEKSIELLNNLIKENGAIVESSEYNNYSYRNSYHISLRVEQNGFNKIKEDIKNIGNIKNTNNYTENITKQYYDVKSQIENRELLKKKYEELLNDATTTTDLIDIYDRLNTIQWEIDNYKSQLNNYDIDVKYNYLNITLEMSDTMSPTTFVERLSEAFEDSFGDFAYFIEGIIIFFAHSWLFLIFFGVVIIGGLKLIKKISKRRKIKKNAKKLEERAMKIESMGKNIPNDNLENKTE